MHSTFLLLKKENFFFIKRKRREIKIKEMSEKKGHKVADIKSKNIKHIVGSWIILCD